MIARSRPVYIGVPNRECNSMSGSAEVSGGVPIIIADHALKGSCRCQGG